MQWPDVDLQERTVTVRRQVLVRSVQGAPRVFLRLTTKTRRFRAVRFDEATATALQTWKANQAAERLAFGPAWKNGGGVGADAEWVVTEADGMIVHPETLLRRWKRLVKSVGVPSIPLHGARHSYATLSLEAGVRLDVVATQLGHASIATTGNVYAHVSPAAAADAAERLGSVLEGGR